MESIWDDNTDIKQIPFLNKWFVKNFKPPKKVLDFGCGRWGLGVKHLNDAGFEAYGYDPYKLSGADNFDALSKAPYDVCLLSNVLCVISDSNSREMVLRLGLSVASDVYVTVYERDRTGIGGFTSKGWQWNATTVEVRKWMEELGFIVKIPEGIDIPSKKVLQLNKGEFYE